MKSAMKSRDARVAAEVMVSVRAKDSSAFVNDRNHMAVALPHVLSRITMLAIMEA